MKPITHPSRGRTVRRASIALVGLVAIAVTAWLATARWRRATPPSFATAAVARGDVVQSVTASGTLSPVIQINVGSQVSGRVKELLVDYNDEVKQGQVIARIDPQVFDSAVAQAQARLGSARADLRRAQAVAANAKLQHQRISGLITSGAVALADADAALADWRSAEEQVTAASARVTEAASAVEQAKLNLAYTTITAPIDGIVISRSVAVGQTVAASLQAPTLFVIAGDLRRMEVHTAVAESDVGQLQPGIKVTFTVDAFPAKTFTGSVKQVRYEATTTSNVVTYDAVVAVENPNLELRPGMTANATFVIAERKGVLVAPSKALRYRPPQARARAAAAMARRDGGRGRGGPHSDRRPSESVWVLRDGAPVRVAVQTGLSDGTNTEIAGGELREGDLVVTGDSQSPSTPTPPAGNSRRMGPPRVF